MNSDQLLTAAMQAQQAGNTAVALNYLKMAELQQGQKNDPTSLTPGGVYAHGPSGLFNQPGVTPRIFSAMQLPMGGIADRIPVLNAGDLTNNMFSGPRAEFFSYITGVTEGAEDFSDQPTAECADGARAGLMKSGRFAVPYGHFKFSPSATVSLTRAGEFDNLSEPMNLQLANIPGDVGTMFMPSGIDRMRSAVQSEIGKRLFEQYASMKRAMAVRTWVGTPANNNGAARDFMGFDLWINTNNKVDIDSMSVMTALNSDVKNFGYDLVNGSGRDIVRYVEQVHQFLNHKSLRQGLGPWDGEIAMHPVLFNELTKIWPIRAYNELIAQVAALGNNGPSLNISARDSLELRNSFRNESYLPVNGMRVTVAQDDTIVEQTPNQTDSLLPGQYASSIRFIPMRVLGSIPVTFWKYKNQANRQAEDIITAMNTTLPTFTSDNGFYRWHVNYKNGCIDWTVEFEPSLMMLTPQLAGRIDNVAYSPLQHTSEWEPGNDYFTNGGITSTTTQQYYTPWSTSEPANI